MTWQDISTAPRDGRIVSRKRLIAVDFACNDPDDGSFAGKVGMASAHGAEIELDPFGGVSYTDMLATFFTHDGGDTQFTVTGSTIRLHRREFRFNGSADWVGNWCWNRYWFDPKEYRRLVRTLACNGWKCTAGLARWGDAFERLPRKPLPSPPEGR